MARSPNPLLMGDVSRTGDAVSELSESPEVNVTRQWTEQPSQGWLEDSSCRAILKSTIVTRTMVLEACWVMQSARSDECQVSQTHIESIVHTNILHKAIVGVLLVFKKVHACDGSVVGPMFRGWMHFLGPPASIHVKQGAKANDHHFVSIPKLRRH